MFLFSAEFFENAPGWYIYYVEATRNWSEEVEDETAFFSLRPVTKSGSVIFRSWDGEEITCTESMLRGGKWIPNEEVFETAPNEYGAIVSVKLYEAELSSRTEWLTEAYNFEVATKQRNGD